MPIGIPEEAKVKTSNDVKSGFVKVLVSNSFGQGKWEIIPSALATNYSSFLDSSLLTTETKPSNSALTFKGSK